MRGPALLVLLFVVAAPRLPAQIDYRNLDHGRPLATEDAYALERYAFELAVPYALEHGDGSSLHLVAPEFSHGVARNTQASMELPFAAADGPNGDGTRWGIAGPRLSLLYNFNTEGRTIPGLGVRGELVVPLGALAPDDAMLTVTALVTRSWGRTRMHVNAAATLGPVHGTGVAEPPEWQLTAAVDRTLLRQSLLLLGEIGVRWTDLESATTAGIGGRLQLTPTLVLDVGMTARLGGDVVPDLDLTVGIAHSFGLAWILPGRSR